MVGRGAGELKISPLETQINHKEKTCSLFGNDRHANYGKTKQNKTILPASYSTSPLRVSSLSSTKSGCSDILQVDTTEKEQMSIQETSKQDK